MSPDSDRIAVPTNGKGPHTVPDAVEPASAQLDEGSAVPFTPAQLAVGLGVIASLVLVLVGLVRRRRPDDDD